MSKSSKPIPIAIPNPLLAQIDWVAEHKQRSRADIMRLAMEIGLEDLRRANYDIAGAIVDLAKGVENKSERDTMLPITTLSETPAIYGKKKPA